MTRNAWLCGLAALEAVICAFLAWVCWQQGHVTYGLPDGGEGHHLVSRAITGAVICAVLAVALVLVGAGALRVRPAWVVPTIMLLPLVAIVVAIVATNGPTPTYAVPGALHPAGSSGHPSSP